MLKEVLELTEKEANLFLFERGGRYITTSFTVDEEVRVVSMFPKDVAFNEVFNVIFIFHLCRIATPPTLAVVFMCCLLGMWIHM